ncbi:MAG: shikimate kinase [Phycisphaerales bacterium]|nr:shikimate kinase [Phycisphaerales bacterium]
MLILMGLRGSGKSTVGRLVGAALNVPFADLDDRTAMTAVRKQLVPAGSSVAVVLQTLGEQRFRRIEEEALFEAVNKPACDIAVLALGGGTPTHPGSLAVIQARLNDTDRKTQLVYLRATPATLAARLNATDLSQRPSLTGRGVVEEIGELFANRDPLYTSIATRIIDVDGLTPQQTASLILRPPPCA